MELEEPNTRESAMIVLVVEDEALIRVVVSDLLRETPGVTVVEAATADEAWHYLQNHGPVDVVFTDHRMPGTMTGSQLAIRVKQEYPNTRILVTSSHFDGKEWSEPVLQKPYDMDKTAARIIGLARKEG